MPPKAKNLLAANADMRAFPAPSLTHWLEDGPHKPFEYTKTFHEAAFEPFAVIHSSGTTGLPKPITLNHAHVLQQSTTHLASANPQNLCYGQFAGLRVAQLCPITIAAAIYQMLGLNFLYGFTPVLAPPTGPTSAAALKMMIHHADVQAVITNPKIFPGAVQDPATLDRLETHIGVLGYLGAPCPQHLGEILSQRTHLMSLYGSTEANMPPAVVLPREDWASVSFDPRLVHTMRPTGRLGYHELVLQRDDAGDFCQAVFKLFPDALGWPMSDLFRRHPDPAKADRWRYLGRVEDLLYGDGSSLDDPSIEPFLPNAMESAIESSELVGAAVVAANRAGALAIVVEPAPGVDVSGPADRAHFVRNVWPFVERANAECPVPGRVERGLVVVATRPLLRGAKGSPNRKALWESFREEIDAAYKSHERQDVGLSYSEVAVSG